MLKVQDIAHKMGGTPKDMLQKLRLSGFKSTLDRSIDHLAVTLHESRLEESYRGSKSKLLYV